MLTRIQQIMEEVDSMRKRGGPAGLALVAMLAGASLIASGLSAQSTVDIASRSSASIFRVMGEYGQGSGFLVDRENGLVLTNAHVTAGQEEVEVKLDPRYKVIGHVLLEDRRRDVAVVRISPEAVADRLALKLDAAAYSDVRVGAPLVVMGFPLNRGVVVTEGILSQKGEGIFITDAGVHPGNSGGPVLSESGAVLGVTTFLAASDVGGGLGGPSPLPSRGRS